MSARASRTSASGGAGADGDASAVAVAADDASTAAPPESAEAAVADLLQLHRAVTQAAASKRSGAKAEAEARDRLLAAATASQPADSLITAFALHASVAARLAAAAPACASLRPSTLQARADAVATLWRKDAALLRASRSLLSLLTARHAAGSLWVPTPAERAFFADDAAATGGPVELLGGEMYASCARDALRWWPSSVPVPASDGALPEADEARLRGVHGALSALLAHDGAAACGGRTLAAAAPAFALAVRSLLSTLSLTAAAPVGAGAGAALLAQLRASCGLTRGEEAALRKMEQRLSASVEKEQLRATAAPVTKAAHATGGSLTAAFGVVTFVDLRTLSRERATRGVAADHVARTTLRRCALPECDTREARPRAFMLCARCRGAAYCCALHQTHDWRRHKVTDGCTPSESHHK
jgi:hypothetical protein